MDSAVGGLARPEHREPFPERHAKAGLRRRLGLGRRRRLFRGFLGFLLSAAAIAGVPEVDVEPLDLVAQQEDCAARGAHLFPLVER